MRVVASLIANGTSSTRANVLANNVLPDPVGPLSECILGISMKQGGWCNAATHEHEKNIRLLEHRRCSCCEIVEELRSTGTRVRLSGSSFWVGSEVEVRGY